MRGLLDSGPGGREALLARARALSGYTLGELGARHRVDIPCAMNHAKGLAGRLLELALEADAGNRAVPDFAKLGVELKTIPMDRRGRPRESTFVSSIALRDVDRMEWTDSRAAQKLRCVLWVPLEAEPGLPLPARRIGRAVLWSPTAAQEEALRRDWENLIELIASGQSACITAHLGRYLQVRPKARSSRARTIIADEYGAPQPILPRGFYLRRSFTAQILSASGVP